MVRHQGLSFRRLLRAERSILLIALIAAASCLLLWLANQLWWRSYATYVPATASLNQARHAASQAFVLQTKRLAGEAIEPQLVAAQLDNAALSAADGGDGRSPLSGIEAAAPDPALTQLWRDYQAALARFDRFSRELLFDDDGDRQTLSLQQRNAFHEAERAADVIEAELGRRLAQSIGEQRLGQAVGLGLWLGFLGLTLLLLARSAHAEASLVQQEQLIRAVLAASPDAIVVKDRAGRYTLFNDGAARMVGRKAAEILGQTDDALFEPAFAAELQQYDQSVIDGGQVVLREEVLPAADGNTITLSTIKGPLLDQGGRPFGLFAIARDISALKRTEAALRENEQRLRLALDAARAGTWEWNLATNQNYWSDEIWRLYGLEPGSCPPSYAAWRDNIHPEDREPVEQLVRQAVAGGAEFEFERRVLLPTGEPERWLLSRGRPVRDDQGRITRYIGVVFDISARKRAETALHERQQALKTAQTLARVGSWSADFRAGTIHFSPEAARINDLPTEPVPWATFLAIVHPDDLALVAEAWNRADASDIFLEHRILVAGKVRWVEKRAEIVHDGGGQALRALGMTHDITETREAQLALRAANERLEATVEARTAELARTKNYLQGLLDAIPALVGYYDRALCSHFANRAYHDWFGLDATQIPGRHFREILGDTVYQANRQEIEGALRGERQQFERLYPRPDGQGLRYSQTIYIPDFQGDQVQGFFVLANDITAVREAEQAAQAARREAERLAQVRSEFVANMSHEIRTPINAIMGLAYLLDHPGLTPGDHDLVTKLRAAGRSLVGIINDILDFSKIEAGRMALEMNPFRLGEVLDQLAVIMNSAAGTKPLELLIGPVPEGAATLVGDALRLEQVLVNLASNAIKFTEHGEVVVSVTRLADDPGERSIHLRFAVRDSGIGIAPEQQQEIFSAFTQADSSTTRRFGGTGLGLSISKRMVELMGGEIGLISTPGQGSEFWFTLPFAPAAGDQPPLPALTRQRLLIADDHPLTLALLAETVQGLGWQAETVDNGRAAIERTLQRHREGRPFDVVLLDWLMPEVDGLAAGRAIRDTLGSAAAPVIAMITAFARDDLVRHHQEGVIDVILPKPVTASALFNAVGEAKRRRGGNMADAPAGTQATAPAVIGSGARPRRLAGVRLLVVDDSELNLEVARLFLEQEGAEVSLARRGEAAVEQLRRQERAIDVVLMDVQMPGMDGYQTTRQIRQELGLTRLPILAVTAGVLEQQRAQALAAGMNGFLAKPFEHEALVTAVCAALGSSGPPRP